MLYRKQGYPEEDELVLCTVTKIHYHSVFCTLDEYGKSGMIHISEVSPGRIRNIRDYVQEGKKVVCKVLRVDEEKNHIDLSLRRVTEAQRKAKISMIKQEQRAEKIIASLAERLGTDVSKLYKEVTDALFKHYDMLFLAFEDVVENDASLEKHGLKKEIAKPLEELVKEKIKPKQVTIKGLLTLSSFAEDGVEVIRKLLAKAEKVEGVSIRYAGGGTYRVLVTAPDYKQAEKHLEEALSVVSSGVAKNGSYSFERTDSR